MIANNQIGRTLANLFSISLQRLEILLESSVECTSLSFLEKPLQQLPQRLVSNTSQPNAAPNVAVMKLAARDAAHQSHAAAHTGAVVDATQCKLHDPLKDLKNWFLTLQKDALKAADAATAGFSLVLEPKLPTQLETPSNDILQILKFKAAILMVTLYLTLRFAGNALQH